MKGAKWVRKTADGRQAAAQPLAALTWEQVRAWRLQRQHLLQRAPRAAMLDVAGAICGLHAQVMSSAALTLWARVADLEPETVARELWEERSLVKTWAMRGTLHLLPAAEFALWRAALGTRQHFRREGWLRGWGITAGEMDRLVAAIAAALDGRTLTREELVREVGRLTGSAELGERLRESWGGLLKPAAYLGQLCFAPGTGPHVRFTRPDRWLQTSLDEMDPAVAMREIVRRYLTCSGPATREDLARWWGTTVAAASRLIAGLGDEVAPVAVEGTPAWMLASDVAAAREAGPVRSVRLLPAFDQYVVAATCHARALLPGDLRDRVYRTQGWLSPVVLVNGRMDGVWRHERKGHRLLVRIEPFVALPRWAKQATAAEAERLADFLGGRLELSWSA